ncbi:MocE family 2Fe-2S type ferredoxin [Mameliella sediminis]|uniref:MocE family 2Fe-2S type ferredoxin n=1 Tax=Mameliella sediminis TaxID=2836866 RepID=UPI001C4696AD|nr:MocE family 2Fe-2S type ferredoxin [Mameliella sediminis]MBY6116980.1 Rieske 2Fe-2S domain-containing protein [Antarctobacter heliothermus]MBY6146733.1 Rieske 2Fe-2S domain-containing protein [Mameliella alba]MBV7397143.1 Rieske 2Fe-2S domain-containing protein [Mameliella sediminis]MBY6163681.1 Rieske 2Fe-2S domain-containing protein [Mameliella alba]MBY6171988.1 Rieske 2Fe-2S domain-containing protein [Mameliella alba]
MTTVDTWIDACAVDDIETEDLIGFSHDGKLYAIYRSPDDQFYATDGHCSHEKVSLADGLVMDHIIECPMHNARFDYRTGEVKSAPACVNLRTYPVRREGDRILIAVG